MQYTKKPEKTNKNSSTLRIPPQSIESEQAVIASVMIRQGALYDIEDIITADAFYSTKNKDIWRAIEELSTKHEPIDIITVGTRLSEKGILESIGGQAYLAELVSTFPSTGNVKYYATIIDRKYRLRKLIEASDRISEIAFNEEGELDEIIDQSEKEMFQVTSQEGGKKFIPIKQTLADAYERIEKLHETPGGLRGISTGFRDLDLMLSGFQEGDLIILAARPSMGKTTLALDIARKTACEHNVSVGIFSLEMDATQLVDRMLSAEARVNAWNLRTGKLSSDNEFQRLRDSLDKLSKAPIFIDDQSGNSITKMKSYARKLKSEHGLGLIIVDYLQLISPSKNYDNMVNQVTEISRALKGMAKDLKVPVLALSQLSRNVEQRGGKPRLSDLRDSGSIEQDADMVMFIHREDKYKDESEKTNIAEILIEKHRNGPVGKVDLYFDEKMTSFLDLDKDSVHSQYASSSKNLDEF